MRQSEVLSLMRENVSYKLQHGRAKEAVDMLEKLHKYATVKSVFFFVLKMNYSKVFSRTTLRDVVLGNSRLIRRARSLTVYVNMYSGQQKQLLTTTTTSLFSHCNSSWMAKPANS